ncbi:MAG: hypothetical protein ACXWUG_30355 [Polyangiales bacterium]
MRTLLAVLLVVPAVVGCAESIPLEKTKKGGQSAVTDSAPSTTDTGSADDTALTDDTATDDTGSIDDDTGTIEDTRIDPPDTTGDPCGDCVSTSCGSEGSACFSDTACTDLVDCLSACSDDACASACMTAHPSPVYDAFLGCVSAKCSAPCGGP